MAQQPLILPVTEYAPDQPDYQNNMSDNVLNVIPKTASSYGPINAPTVFSGALPSRCQGAYFGLASDGTVAGFAGDSQDLWEITQATAPAWTNVSKSSHAYAISADDQWRATLYGTRVIFTNLADPVQSFVLGTSTKFADLIVTANPPKAKFCAVSKTYLVLGATSDGIYGSQPQRVWWSRNGNPTAFDDPGAQAQLASQFETGYQDLLGDGGKIQGIVGNLGNADIGAFQEHAIWRGVWVGGGAGVFQFFPAQGVRGCAAPGSIAQLGSIVYYLGEDGFYAFDGAQARPIGVFKVDKTFYSDLDQNFLGSISAAIDPINKLYIVLYPGAGHNGRNANRMLLYNWALDRWSQALPIPGGSEFVLRALSFGYTLDQIYTILGYKLDTMPFPLDSRVWTGGNLLLGIFDGNHKLNYFTGNTLDATVDTSEAQFVPGQVMRINNARPIVDGSATPSVALGVRNRQVDTVTFTNAVPMTSLGTCPQRAVGRYIRTRITVPGSASSWTHLSGVELDGAPAGARY